MGVEFQESITKVMLKWLTLIEFIKKDKIWVFLYYSQDEAFEENQIKEKISLIYLHIWVYCE